MRKMKLFLVALAGMVAVSSAQVEQRTTVVKSTSSNPTIGIVDFRGANDVRAKLEDALERCGWFNVCRDGKARTAEIRMNVSVSSNAGINAAAHCNQYFFRQNDLLTFSF